MWVVRHAVVVGVVRRLLWALSGGCCGGCPAVVVGVVRHLLWGLSGSCCGGCLVAIVRVGGCPAVVAQWQSTGGSSHRCPRFDSWPAFSLSSILAS